MKVLVYFSFTMLLILIFGCKSSEEFVKFKPYKIKDYITKEIKVYEVKEWLYPILDSVVMKTEDTLICQRFENEITFFFEIGLTCSVNAVDLVISAENSIDSFNHAVWTDAVFFYKGYKFYCGRTFLNSFFKKTNETISLVCIDPKKYRWDISGRSKPKMEWIYCIEMRDD